MPKQYRILHLIKSLGRGGAEVLLHEGLAHSNRQRFVYSFGYFLPWKNAMVKPLQESGAEVVCFSSKGPAQMFLSTSKVISFLRAWKADLIHCHLPLAGVIGRIAAKRLGIPLVYTEHNVMERYHPWTRRLNLWTWNWQKMVIAVSAEVSASIRQRVKNSVPVRIVQNGVPVEKFERSDAERSRIRAKYGIPENAPVIGTIAVFRPQKDLDNWLKAAKIVKQRCPETHFLLIGDGILKEQIQATAAELKLTGCCHFTGLQETVAPFYSAMDIYYNSSTFEGLPLTVLEAMAMQLPVIATSVGGVPEVVVNEETGFLIEPRKPELAAEKLIPLISNPALRNNFGSHARKRVEEQFSMQRMSHDLESIYTDLLEHRSIVS